VQSKSQTAESFGLRSGFESISQKPDRGHPVRQASEARSRLAERIFREVIRAVSSGGQDVSDPFLKDQRTCSELPEVYATQEKGPPVTAALKVCPWINPS
jgi:hypothetical protein